MTRKRQLIEYKHYFEEFYLSLTAGARKKIFETLKLIEVIDIIPVTIFRKLHGTDGIYEIRVRHWNNIYRIFCFFDNNNIIVIGHGFQKKTQKTPRNEIEKAEKIKRAYYEEKQSHNP